MSQHTPGPWEVLVQPPNMYDTLPTYVVRAGVRRDIAVMEDYFFSEDLPVEAEAEANARRIVACVNACEGIADPSVVRELLAALEGFLHADPDVFADELAAARAAIARANASQQGD